MSDKNASGSKDVNTDGDPRRQASLGSVSAWLDTDAALSPALLSQVPIVTSHEKAEPLIDPGPATCLTKLDVEHLLDRMKQQGITAATLIAPAEPIVLGPLWAVTNASWCRHANAVFVYPNVASNVGVLVEEPRSSIIVTMMNVQATAVVVELVNVGITPEGFSAVTTDDNGGSSTTRVAFSAPGIFLVRSDAEGNAVLRIAIGSGRTFVKQVILRPVI